MILSSCPCVRPLDHKQGSAVTPDFIASNNSSPFTGHCNLSNKPRNVRFPPQFQQSARKNASVLQGKACSVVQLLPKSLENVLNKAVQQHPTCFYPGYTRVHRKPPACSLPTGGSPLAWERYVGLHRITVFQVKPVLNIWICKIILSLTKFFLKGLCSLDSLMVSHNISKMWSQR